MPYAPGSVSGESRNLCKCLRFYRQAYRYRSGMRMSIQMTLGAGFEKYTQTTRGEKFRAEMDSVVPWAELCPRTGPKYPKAGDDRRPKELKKMLRVYVLQLSVNLSAPEALPAGTLSSRGPRYQGGHRHDCGCRPNQRAILQQEQSPASRCGDALGQKGQPAERETGRVEPA